MAGGKPAAAELRIRLRALTESWGTESHPVSRIVARRYRASESPCSARCSNMRNARRASGDAPRTIKMPNRAPINISSFFMGFRLYPILSGLFPFYFLGVSFTSGTIISSSEMPPCWNVPS